MSSLRTIGTFNVDLFDQDYIVKGLQRKTISKFGNHWGQKKQDNFVWEILTSSDSGIILFWT
jgi:hypothetical protein